MHSHADEDINSVNNLKTAFFLNLSFTLIELVGGLFSGSMAILADAVHDMGDCVFLSLAIYLQSISTKKHDKNYSYGYRRFSLISALASGVIIIMGSIVILWESVPRLGSPQAVNGPLMLALAVLGVLVNGFAAMRLGKGHSHNEKFIHWHFLEDTLGWAAVLVGAVFVMIFKWYWVDPLLAIFVALFVMWNVVKNLRSTVKIFLQAKPEHFNEADFCARVQNIPNVRSLHDLHIWSLDGRRAIVSMHVVIRGPLTEATFKYMQRVKEDINKIAHDMGHAHVTTEFEFEGDMCHENCDDN